MKPFLKWAGGKRWLFESRQFTVPSFTGRYIEPFLGGGAVYFHTQPKHAVLSDSNFRLIELYKAIRDDLEEFETLFKSHAKAHTKEYYYKLRQKKLRKSTSRAAQFLYLNRTCWNGLYRENLRGEFNVPIGTKQKVIFENDDFLAWSLALQGTRLVHGDFESIIDESKEGDFVFADPPYTIRHNFNGFVKYNQEIFAWEDQVRLRNAFIRAVNRGVSFALTNADNDNVRKLYSGLGKHRRLHRHSVIAAKPIHRSSSTELLVTFFSEIQ